MAACPRASRGRQGASSGGHGPQGDHPDDAVPIFQREVERLIETKKNHDYADAVALMDHVRELLGQAGRPGGFAPYAEKVRATHKPTRNLMKLFDGKGW